MTDIDLTEAEIARIKQIFQQFDKNNNNTIDKKELAIFARALNDSITPAELHDFFKCLDKDNSSTITWEEFIKYWTSN